MRYLAFILAFLFFGLAGCATTQWLATPEQSTADNSHFKATVRPICVKTGITTGYGCSAFDLTILNKTAANIEINWNKTAYISAGQTRGGLMFEGVVYRERNSPKQPDVVFPNSTFRKTVWPNALVSFAKHWDHEPMPTGENGIYLVVNVDGKEITERLTTRLITIEK